MYRTAFLGVENSHADTFLRFMKEDKDGEFSDIEAAGVYSVDPAASAKLHEKYGVPVMESPDELAGRVDGVIVTARHGDFHLPYAKPYLGCGIPAFIDKPVTVSESDARELASLLEKYRVPYTGGSCLKYSPSLLALRDAHLSGEGGKTVGGVLRCPISMSSPYGGFYFYAQHLVEAVITVFGDGIKTVGAHRTASGATAVFSYDGFDVTGCFTEGIYRYEAYRFVGGSVSRRCPVFPRGVQILSQTAPRGGRKPVCGALHEAGVRDERGGPLFRERQGGARRRALPGRRCLRRTVATI